MPKCPDMPKWMPSLYQARLYNELSWCEGKENQIYRDSRGNWSGGIGWNFTANGIPEWVVQGLFNQAVTTAADALDANIPWWRYLDDVRQRAVLNLCFNMGWPRLSGFVHMLAALRQHDFGEAAKQLVDSEWWNEVGKRGPFVKYMIEKGLEPAGID